MYWFSNAFKLSPEIIDIKVTPPLPIIIKIMIIYTLYLFIYQDIQYAYRSVCRGKDESTIQMGLDYDEFLEILVRIAIKGKIVFNKWADNMNGVGDPNNIDNIVAHQEKFEKDKANKVESVDDYGDISLVNGDTI